MKQAFLTQLEDGEIASSQNAAVALMRLQQIASGWLAMDDGSMTILKNARIEALREIADAYEGEKIIVWARFNDDIRIICETFGEEAVSYFGDTETEDRETAVASFLDPDNKVRFFVSNPRAGGVGLNLQGNCSTVVYYSNSFSALDRWQSEDRSHRIGTHKNVTYIDMIAKGTVDRKILGVLRNKKEVAALALGDFKRMLEDES